MFTSENTELKLNFFYFAESHRRVEIMSYLTQVGETCDKILLWFLPITFRLN